MTDLDPLINLIYHERQQEGSMLCAQHALNSLLQGNYFTAPDLAAIAQSFDTLERDALGGEERASTNMDDSGFFSIQVIEKALEVWGLSLVRWRSEQMRPFNASPHTQLAFVLNLHQHWFTLRRFGPAMTDASRDPGDGHWFNLNSSYDRPRWVSRTYLGMFLEQSEQEGYSVFAVVQSDPSKPLALPRTDADNIATAFEAPDNAPGHSSSTSSAMPGAFPNTAGVAHDGDGEVVIPPEKDYDMADEDMELQAALAASLGGGSGGGHNYGAYTHSSAPPLAQIPPAARISRAPVHVEEDDDDDDGDGDYAPSAPPASAEPADPVAASMARNQALLERMLREQEAAFREGVEDDGGAAALRRRQQEEEEDAQLRAAIEASMADHPGSGSSSGDASAGGVESGGQTPPARSVPAAAAGTTSAHDRVYDDEDAELQAALRASLADLPPDFMHPASPPPQAPARPAVTIPTGCPPQIQPPPPSGSETETEDDASMSSSQPPTPAPQLDVEEMRRRRLARFGGGGGGGGGEEPAQES